MQCSKGSPTFSGTKRRVPREVENVCTQGKPDAEGTVAKVIKRASNIITAAMKGSQGAATWSFAAQMESVDAMEEAAIGLSWRNWGRWQSQGRWFGAFATVLTHSQARWVLLMIVPYSLVMMRA